MIKPRDDQSVFFYGYLIIAASAFITAVIWAVYYSFGVFFKPVLSEFGWTRAMTSGAFSLSSIITGCLAIAMGGLTDKVGPRVVMTICGLLLGLGYILMSQIKTVWHLYLFFGVIIGTGMGGSFIPLMSTIARWFAEKRSLMTGIVAASIGVGALIGPKVASRLIPAYGWRLSYVIMGSIVLTVVVLSAQFLKRNPSNAGQVAYGENQGNNKVVNERTDGVSLKEAFFTRQFCIFFLTGFCYGFCVFAIMVHIAPHATELGMSAAGAANILATLGGLSIFGKIFLGRAGDIIGSRQTMLIAFILMSAALLWLVVAEMAWALYVIAALFGFSYGGCAVAQSPLVAILFGLRSHGLIFGVLSVSVSIGGAIGPLLTGHIFDVTGRYQLAFLSCAAVSFAGAVFSTFIKQRRVDFHNALIPPKYPKQTP